ncbi:hypothetical protein [Magnetospirillum sp. SS-4]|uniref:hypothetical protein n=1 Tax=Magnetospirillum sp. SS-4 TaxID=2681465 RepID=UPI001380CEFF|nr:hypothetical protein [Magnetospirillum sp. SS-4]CAA7624761.1 conserved exported hypothetical protein [Magnetospirillum sp. SS-4]
MSSYRVSFIKASGWTRLGVAAGTAAALSAPMLWALGSFGLAEEAIHRAIVYAGAGLWLFLAAGWLTGWAIQGFVIRQKATEDEADDRPPQRPTPPPAPPHSRPAPPPRQGSH